MTASLTPTLAIDFITALSADIRAAAVLDASGAPLAGPAGLAQAARALVVAGGVVAGGQVAGGDDAGGAGGDAAAGAGEGSAAGTGGDASWGELEGEDARGKVFVARDERHVIVVVTGPFALARVTRHDLRTALGGQNAPIGPPGRLGEARTGALLSAV